MACCKVGLISHSLPEGADENHIVFRRGPELNLEPQEYESGVTNYVHESLALGAVADFADRRKVTPQ